MKITNRQITNKFIYLYIYNKFTTACTTFRVLSSIGLERMLSSQKNA